MKKNILTLIYIIATIAMLSSCQKCDLNPTNQHGLTLMIQNPVAETLKATEACNNVEAGIHTLHLFFFNEQGQQVYSHYMEQFDLNQKLLVIINQEQKELFKGQVKHTVYAVANINETTYSAIKGKTLNEFQQYVISEPFINDNDRRFVMVASVNPSQNLQLGGYNNIGTFKLKHLLAKVRLTLDSNIEIDGFSCVDKKIQLINTTDRTYLDRELIPGDISYKIQEKSLSDNQVVFYTYPNKWDNSSMKNRTHIALKLKLKDNQSNDEGNFYFYDASIDNQQMAIKANHLYDIKITVNKLGSIVEEAPLDLTGNIIIRDWIIDEKQTDNITETHYLSVADTEVNMGYSEQFFVDYETSTPVEVVDVKSSFTYVPNNTGVKIVEQTRDDQVATVTLVNGKIRINSKLPVNYNPKDITFTIKHIDRSTGIAPINITVKQYPSTYILNTEGVRSVYLESLSGEPQLNNKSIYSITTMMTNLEEFGPEFKNFVLGYPMKSRKTFYFYTLDNNAYQYYGNVKPVKIKYGFSDQVTTNSEEVANMISPSFELASQLGATHLMSYELIDTHFKTYQNLTATLADWGKVYNENAIANCAFYWEDRIADGKVERLTDWRLPTKAEIKLIDFLQSQNTAVKEIMNGLYYWSNLSNGAIHIEYPGAYGTATSTLAHVRCIRDIK